MPAGYSDLNPFDFFLYRPLKIQVSATPPESPQMLREIIAAECRLIMSEMLQKLLKTACTVEVDISSSTFVKLICFLYPLLFSLTGIWAVFSKKNRLNKKMVS